MELIDLLNNLNGAGWLQVAMQAFIVLAIVGSFTAKFFLGPNYDDRQRSVNRLLTLVTTRRARAISVEQAAHAAELEAHAALLESIQRDVKNLRQRLDYMQDENQRLHDDLVKHRHYSDAMHRRYISLSTRAAVKGVTVTESDRWLTFTEWIKIAYPDADETEPRASPDERSR